MSLLPHMMSAALSGPDVLLSPNRLTRLLSPNDQYTEAIMLAVRFVLVGALITGTRKAFAHCRGAIEHALFPCAYIGNDDQAYLWIMAFLAQDPSAQAQIHHFQLSTGEWRILRKKSNAPPKNVSKVGEQNATWQGKDILGQVMPAYNYTIRIKHKGHYLWIMRAKRAFANTTQTTQSHFRVQTFAFSPEVLKDFLSEVHASYHAKEETEILVYHPFRIKADWHGGLRRPARPWDSVILPNGVKEDLLKDIEKFLSEKETSWYAARGIPHRRGYLFHGDPGSGKTTLVTAIASKLSLDIYIINPSQRGMDDSKLNKLFRCCPPRSLILIEDIDCIMPRTSQRIVHGASHDDGQGAEGSNPAQDMVETVSESIEESPKPIMGGTHDLSPSTVTLSGLLNAIDGVSSQEGCLLIASTNHPNRLDAALSRPGRFDVHIAFTSAEPSQAEALFRHFYPLTDCVDQDDIEGADEKASLCITTRPKIDALAERFVASIFPSGEKDRVGGKEGATVSMASLQGYLLKHKEDPRAAADQAAEWATNLGNELQGSANKPKPQKKQEEAAVADEGDASVAATEKDGASVPEPESIQHGT